MKKHQHNQEIVNVIYQLKDKSIGTGITVKYLEQTYPDLFRAISIHDIDSLASDSIKVWRLQNPYFYKYPCIKRINDYVMCRKEYASFFPGKKLVDGYSYYRNYISRYQSWFPTIYQSHFECNSIPSIGFYVRDMRTESTLKFLDFVKDIKDNIPIITMGDKACIEPYLVADARWQHTYDNSAFWKSCSHYFYYRCSDFEDPFPQNLLEAIQSGHRIISPIDSKRNFIDGIDDFLSCIDYDIKFIPDRRGKVYDALSSKTWSKYMHSLVHSEFRKFFPLNKGLLYDWICKALR